jgi:hypothetical protein
LGAPIELLPATGYAGDAMEPFVSRDGRSFPPATTGKRSIRISAERLTGRPVPDSADKVYFRERTGNRYGLWRFKR